MTTHPIRRFLELAPLALALLAPVAAQAADERVSYAFVRTLEGEATVVADGQGIGELAEVNQPLLTGDRIRVEGGSRVEVLLPDRNRLQLDSGSVVTLSRLAVSGDREDRTTLLRVEEGEILLEVSDEALGDELPRLETPNAEVFVHEPGLYRVTVEPAGWTEVLTRRGFAEVVTDRGSTIVRAEEAALVQGDRWTRVELTAAGALDRLESWDRELSERAARAASRERGYVEPHLAYASAPLDDYGDWIVVGSANYWRPRVGVGWRPYWDGRWGWTPSGYTWISYEPWGWVPYHYGSWSILAGYGWAWRPGPIYSPAWVYWNWSNGWAGWCPTGYYTGYYDPWFHHGFRRYGHYGWAGGGWGLYSDWNFAPLHCFRDRRFRGHVRSGHDLHRENRVPAPHRGLITTDSREFRPERLDRPEDLLHQIGLRKPDANGQPMADVTDFVARKKELPPDVVRAIAAPPGDNRRTGDTKLVQSKPGWRTRGEAPGKPEIGLRAPEGRGTAAGGKAPTVGSGRRVEPGTPGTPGATPSARSRVEGDLKARVLPPTRGAATTSKPEARSTPGAGARASSSEDRQGWKRSLPESGTSRSEVTLPGASAKEPPVERVVGSVRRGTPREDPARVTGSPAWDRGKSTSSGGGSSTSGAPRSAPMPRTSIGQPASPKTYGTPRSIERRPGVQATPSPRTSTPAPTTRSQPSPRTSIGQPTPSPTYGSPRGAQRTPGAQASPSPRGASPTPSVRSQPAPRASGSAPKASSGSAGSRPSGSTKSTGGSGRSSGSGSSGNKSSSSGGSKSAGGGGGR